MYENFSYSGMQDKGTIHNTYIHNMAARTKTQYILLNREWPLTKVLVRRLSIVSTK